MILKLLPEQIVADCKTIAGTGFTSTVRVKAVPGQALEIGVIVYSAVLGKLLVLLNVCVIRV
jgi:hypothetical protein